MVFSVQLGEEQVVSILHDRGLFYQSAPCSSFHINRVNQSHQQERSRLQMPHCMYFPFTLRSFWGRMTRVTDGINANRKND